MEAITPKDTVMTAEQLLAIENKFHLGENLADYKGLRDYIIDKVIARMQAKISFKAGKEEGAQVVRLHYPELPEALSDHVTDAIGIGIHHLGQRKLEQMNRDTALRKKPISQLLKDGNHPVVKRKKR
ncbi:hypothetical protein LCGC14_2367280 [marine sediment metagenome]|uniref:Uncharacterized protein n=1 Tax=marine sediment metagenome TaxID=412755 RepID=A0A0F9CS33_9ZZZZ